MATILQMTKRLEVRAEVTRLPRVLVRHYGGPSDVDAWLQLRQRSFAHQQVRVGGWDRGDFSREFLEKWWWKPQHIWFAETNDRLLLPAETVGSVTLAWRGEPGSAKPVVHWLMVHPRCRKRGIARLLMSLLEAACWDAGHRQVWLETHVRWKEAVKFYEALGYAPEPVGSERKCAADLR